MDGRKNNWNGTVTEAGWDGHGTVTEAGWDGHGTVTLSGQKRKIYCKNISNILTFPLSKPAKYINSAKILH